MRKITVNGSSKLITKSLSNFKPCKTTGTSGIFPDILQNTADHRIVSTYTYNACVRLA